MIGSFTIYDCSGLEGAFAWGVAWQPEGEEWGTPSGYLELTQGRLFENVGLTGRLGTIYLGQAGVFPLPGPSPETTVLQPAPFGPFTLENDKTYCINAQTGVLTEMAPEYPPLNGISTWMPLIGMVLVLGMVAMVIPMMKGAFKQ